MEARRVHTASASDAETVTEIRIPVAAVRCARRAFAAPIAWAVRVAVATARESGTNEAEGREVRDDLVPTHHARPEPRDEQGDEREGRRLDRVGQAHRDAEVEELAEDPPARPGSTALEAAIKRVEPGVRPVPTTASPVHEYPSHRSPFRAQT